ncbi:MarR family winged helix-turn-helix transcriptional regulator [Neobittarella massiliensis]|uniref:Winged helix-turn-helix transcriptional regulator n=2 Tax=Oscillospiraceae TaxID=216572 RepID=A0A8J6IDJ2_9FIRM|nr:MarR family winged helix-turn-helix transcriptional regulator [Neobittarella massiliensis]MBC3515240.1 winged helix-turn-helix transcriptional regulator [Neobittarella massiliensis]SCJ61661.1 Regulator of autolytic activity [uncultured Anaerotruncus sp.]
MSELGDMPRISYPVSTLYRRMQRYLSRKLAEEGLPVEAGQLPALLHTYWHPGITQDGIAAGVGIDKGTAARALARLEELSLICRVPDEVDKRVRRIHLTEQGLAIRQQVMDIYSQMYEILYQGLSQQEIAQAAALLGQLSENMHRHLRDTCRGKRQP